MRPQMPKLPRIMIVEDEIPLAEMIKLNLEVEGFEVFAVADGASAVLHQGTNPFDLIILDIMLPKMNGFEVLAALRRRDDAVPVLILTARSGDDDRVQGLSGGADDYLTKPFSILELIARVRAILRRSSLIQSPKRIIQSGPYRIDLLLFTAYRGKTDLKLGLREFRLLEVLVTHPGRVHGRQDLVNLAWEFDARPTLRTVDKHIASLRKKLGETEAHPVIQTLDREGYRWLLPVKP